MKRTFFFIFSEQGAITLTGSVSNSAQASGGRSALSNTAAAGGETLGGRFALNIAAAGGVGRVIRVEYYCC